MKNISNIYDYQVGKDAGISRIRNEVPSAAFKRGLTARAKQDAREQGSAVSKAYFLYNEVPRSLAQSDSYAADAQSAQDKLNRGTHVQPWRLYQCNQLASYAYTFGWRAVPGVRWAAQTIGKNHIAKRFEKRFNSLLREADALHDAIMSQPASGVLISMGQEYVLSQSILRRMRKLFDNVMIELRGHPRFRDELRVL